MPQFKPSILISDAFGSAGDITFYHRNGKCFTRKKAVTVFRGTAGQLAGLEIHRRALAAWRGIAHETQLVWNEYAEEVEPHKPPFDHKAHISGQNLFVSAYHGFVTLGNEHVPEPQRFIPFPPFSISLSGCLKSEDRLVLPVIMTLDTENNPTRYRLLAKIQLAEPGKGRNPGLMRNFLAEGFCGSESLKIVIDGYSEMFGVDGEAFQVHGRFILLDTLTGYRSQYQEKSFHISCSP